MEGLLEEHMQIATAAQWWQHSQQTLMGSIYVCLPEELLVIWT